MSGASNVPMWMYLPVILQTLHQYGMRSSQTGDLWTHHKRKRDLERFLPFPGTLSPFPFPFLGPLPGELRREGRCGGRLETFRISSFKTRNSRIRWW